MKVFHISYTREKKGQWQLLLLKKTKHFFCLAEPWAWQVDFAHFVQLQPYLIGKLTTGLGTDPAPFLLGKVVRWSSFVDLTFQAVELASFESDYWFQLFERDIKLFKFSIFQKFNFDHKVFRCTGIELSKNLSKIVLYLNALLIAGRLNAHWDLIGSFFNISLSRLRRVMLLLKLITSMSRRVKLLLKMG